MAQEKLGVVVLGAGAWADSAHIPGWIRDPRAEILAICDPKIERAEQFAAKFDIPVASDDWQSVVSRADVDVVDVCTPSDTHYELSMAALESDKHVLCEKPVAFDFRETRRAARSLPGPRD